VLRLDQQRVIVTGGAGFLGRHVVKALLARGVPEGHILVPRSAEYDLRHPDFCEMLLARAVAATPAPQGPWGSANPRDLATLIIHCAGFVGGLGANRAHPGRFFHDNLAMGLNLIEAARQTGFIERAGTIVVIGTMCSYPAEAPCPYREDWLWRGRPDPEVASYGLAKLALLQLLGAYRLEHGLKSAYVIPTGFYGPGDNTNPVNSHVAGAFVKKYVDAAMDGAPEVVNWGTGAPLRDLIYIEDAAEGVVRVAEVMDEPTPINLAGGEEVSIRDLAALVSRLAGYGGRTVWDATKGDGQLRRSLDIGRAKELLGWSPRVSLEEGLARMIAAYRQGRTT